VQSARLAIAPDRGDSGSGTPSLRMIPEEISIETRRERDGKKCAR